MISNALKGAGAALSGGRIAAFTIAAVVFAAFIAWV